MKLSCHCNAPNPHLLSGYNRHGKKILVDLAIEVQDLAHLDI